MKKTTVLCMLDDRRDALEKLRNLGLLHIDARELNDSEDRKNLEVLNDETNQVIGIISAIDTSDIDENEFSDLTGEELTSKILKLTEKKTALDNKLRKLISDREILLPWGDFSNQLLNDLKEQGMNIYLCFSPKSAFKIKGSVDNSTTKESIIKKVIVGKTEKNPEDIIVKIVNEDKKSIWFAVISSEKMDKELLPVDKIPQSSLKETEKNIDELNSNISKTAEDLKKVAYYSGKINDYYTELNAKLEFSQARDSMGESDSIVYIDGFIPAPDVDELKNAAEKNGWGLMLRDPKANEDPPTLIKTPKILELSKPIFDFIGISPGYREWDVSSCFLFFFTLFFGIIVGDAGYGLIFLILAILAKIRFRNKKKLELPIRLFILLSISTIIWGLLTGTVFAIPREYLPRVMRGLKWFTDPELKNQHIQQFCFLIAVFHLSLGHIWKVVLYINNRKALGEIGWTCLLWGNYLVALHLIVYPQREWPVNLIYTLYGLGVALTLLFSVKWKQIGDIFNYPFGIVGTFVDLLSYIRLFAVGLATYYIAKSFNDLGIMLLGFSSLTAGFFQGLPEKASEYIPSFLSSESTWVPFAIVFMVLVIFGGHLLNIVLALLAVLVHGIRLNTLEFSNHMALQWLGHVYKPFKKIKEDSKNSDNSQDSKENSKTKAS